LTLFLVRFWFVCLEKDLLEKRIAEQKQKRKALEDLVEEGKVFLIIESLFN